MIVVDTSALMAIVLFEPERDIFLDEILEAPEAVLSAGTLVEAASLYLMAFPALQSPSILLHDLETLGVKIAPLTEDQGRLAAEVRFRFGKGRGGPLNFGDCFSYALARAIDAPLLFKGDDFRQTDVRSAI